MLETNPDDLFGDGEEEAIWVDVLCIPCPACHKIGSVKMPYEAFRKWQDGELIQKAWPQGSTSERELLITGMHSECWDRTIPAG